MKNTFYFNISTERGHQFIAELKAMHAAVPQPASGSTRVFNAYSFDTDDGEQHNADLEYYAKDGSLIFGYYLTIDAKSAAVVYRGEERDFGAGTVGPFRGIDKEITGELRLAEQHKVERDTDGNGELNYGVMSLYSIDGVRFVCRAEMAEHLCGAVVVPTAEIPQFIGHITLRIIINVHYSEVWIYPLRKEDIRSLGEKLSTKRRLTADGFARIYATWEDGKLIDGPKPLSTFYTNITEEQEESFRF